ncbi:MAG TPA: hypothetical protein VK783_16450 [Bacteroidia bacterium]|jgi:hypothetical protein|nr:hypothetical protein [Bacteroidia bacterium]
MPTINKRTTTTLLILLLSVTVFAQRKVFLKWKLQSNEVIAYKTTMQEIDTANYKDLSVNLNGMFGNLGMNYEDSTTNKEIEAIRFLTKLNKYLNSNIITYLTESKKGLIDISMNYQKTDTASTNAKDTSQNDISKMMELMMKNVQLRGAINDSGIIQSFYVKNDQRNLIAIFFQLPDKEIKIGDSWPLDVHFISMDQNFKGDTSYHKNLVSLIGIKKVNGETMAFLKYDITEYVSGDYISPYDGAIKKTMMKMTLNALAEFSVDKGRWVSYDGVMSLIANGMLNSHTIKKVSLLPQ